MKLPVVSAILICSLLPIARGAVITQGTLFLNSMPNRPFDYPRAGVYGPVPNYFSYVELTLRGPNTRVSVVQLGATFQAPQCVGMECVFDFSQLFALEMNQYLTATFTLDGITYENVLTQATFVVSGEARDADESMVCPLTGPCNTRVWALWTDNPVIITGSLRILDAQTRQLFATEAFSLSGRARAQYEESPRFALLNYTFTEPVAVPEPGSARMILSGFGALVLCTLGIRKRRQRGRSDPRGLKGADCRSGR